MDVAWLNPSYNATMKGGCPGERKISEGGLISRTLVFTTDSFKITEYPSAQQERVASRSSRPLVKQRVMQQGIPKMLCRYAAGRKCKGLQRTAYPARLGGAPELTGVDISALSDFRPALREKLPGLLRQVLLFIRHKAAFFIPLFSKL